MGSEGLRRVCVDRPLSSGAGRCRYDSDPTKTLLTWQNRRVLKAQRLYPSSTGFQEFAHRRCSSNHVGQPNRIRPPIEMKNTPQTRVNPKSGTQLPRYSNPIPRPCHRPRTMHHKPPKPDTRKPPKINSYMFYNRFTARNCKGYSMNAASNSRRRILG